MKSIIYLIYHAYIQGRTKLSYNSCHLKIYILQISRPCFSHLLFYFFKAFFCFIKALIIKKKLNELGSGGRQGKVWELHGHKSKVTSLVYSHKNTRLGPKESLFLKKLICIEFSVLLNWILYKLINCTKEKTFTILHRLNLI